MASAFNLWSQVDTPDNWIDNQIGKSGDVIPEGSGNARRPSSSLEENQGKLLGGGDNAAEGLASGGTDEGGVDQWNEVLGKTLPYPGPKTPQSTLPGGWLTQLRAVVTLDFLKWGKVFARFFLFLFFQLNFLEYSCFRMC